MKQMLYVLLLTTHCCQFPTKPFGNSGRQCCKYCCTIKTQKYNLVRMMRFWKSNNLKFLGAIKSKGLNKLVGVIKKKTQVSNLVSMACSWNHFYVEKIGKPNYLKPSGDKRTKVSKEVSHKLSNDTYARWKRTIVLIIFTLFGNCAFQQQRYLINHASAETWTDDTPGNKQSTSRGIDHNVFFCM